MDRVLGGFSDELQKVGGALSFLGGKLMANAIGHALINTRLSPPKVKEFLTRAGDEMMSTGFRHGVTGKSVGPIASTAIGTVISPSAVYMYDVGRKYGETVRRTMEKVPILRATHPFKALSAADTAVTGGLRSAPYLGAVAGGYQGYKTGKGRKKKVPVKSIAAGAITGGLIGAGARYLGPHAPVIKQLKYVRQNVADPVLSGSKSKIGRAMDALAQKNESLKSVIHTGKGRMAKTQRGIIPLV